MKIFRRISYNFKTGFLYFVFFLILINIFGYILGFITITSVKRPSYVINSLTEPAQVSSKPITAFSYLGTTNYYSTSKPVPLIPHYSPCKKIEQRSVDDGRWFNYTTKDAIVYAYTAFYDDRKTLFHNPVIRIIVVSPNDKFYSSIPNYICRLYMPINGNQVDDIQYEIIDVPMLDAKPIGMGWPLNGAVLREFLFTCVPPKNVDIIPFGVGILVGVNNNNDVTSCVPIERPIKPNVKEDIGICVQIAYGTLNSFHLVEWFEIQLLLGATFIGINNMDLDADTLTIIQHYIDRGLVELRQTHYIPHGNQEYMLFGSPAINDCFYRNMYRFNRILVIDFDEIILPKTRNNFKELFSELERNHGTDVPNFLFRNQYFFTDLQRKSSSLNNFKFIALRKAAPISRFGYSAKSAVKPETCIQMHNHFCWQHTAAYSRLQLTDAIPSLATNQHYRSCHLGSIVCQQFYKNSKIDDSIIPYKAAIIDAVNSSIKKILTNSNKDPFIKWKVEDFDSTTQFIPLH